MGVLEREQRLRLASRQGRRRRIGKLARVLLLVFGLGGLKMLVHQLGMEGIPLNPLFTSMVASTVFLLGFLLNGVLSDFKESERLPGEIATSLETLTLEIRAIPAYNHTAEVQRHIEAVSGLGHGILSWLQERTSTEEMLAHMHRCHATVVQASVLLRGFATLQARLMAEMTTLLRLINRIETIRGTTFVPLVYWLAYAGITLLCGGLLFMQTRTTIEAAFFIFVIAFLVILLAMLISDLDNPFDFAHAGSAEDVSLEVLLLALERIRGVVDEGERDAPVPLVAAER